MERSTGFLVLPDLLQRQPEVEAGRSLLEAEARLSEERGGVAEGPGGLVRAPVGPEHDPQGVEALGAFDRKVVPEQAHRPHQGRLGLLVSLGLSQFRPQVETGGGVLHRVPLGWISVQTATELVEDVPGQVVDRVRRVRVLVAGVGNVLRRDDGFGVAVAEALLEQQIPPTVRVVEVGIGGIHLVQELMGKTVDVLIVVDAVDLERPPGTVMVIRPEVLDLTALGSWERRQHLADMHYATPGRALMLARALQVLPEATWVVGCQPGQTEELGEGLTAPVAAAVPEAVATVLKLIEDLGVSGASRSGGA